MPQEITIKAGDTEPLPITVDADGISNLDDVSSAAIYVRLGNDNTNHVDGATVTVSDSANKELTWDPEGAKNGGGDALDAAGTYKAYVKLTWSDGDVTRHPGKGHIKVTVQDSYE